MLGRFWKARQIAKSDTSSLGVKDLVMSHPRKKNITTETIFKITVWQRSMEALCATGREEESWAEVIVKCPIVLRKVSQVESIIFWSWENIAELSDLKANHLGVCTCWRKNPYHIKWALGSKGVKIRIFIEFPFLIFLGLISTVAYFFQANARKNYVGKWNRGIVWKATHTGKSLERLTFTFTRRKVSYPNTISCNSYMTISLSIKARSLARNWESQGQQENDIFLNEVRIHLI